MRELGNFPADIKIAQVTGQNHKECEDIIYTCSSQGMEFMGIADGQSKKKYCREGALACLKEVADYVGKCGISYLYKSRYKDEIQYEILQAIRKRINQLAETYEADRTEFSSTLLILAYCPENGTYMCIHLGDGCVIGVQKEGGLRMISSPDHGVTARYTWLTTSEDALFHIKMCFGKLENYQKICLMTDGAECICKGKNISFRGRQMLQRSDNEELISHLKKSEPQDDASLLILEIMV